MKRKLLSLSLAALCLSALLLIPASAEPISDGAAYFTADATLIKSGYLGEPVRFARSDFEQALGTTDISAVTVTALPEASDGSLLLSSSRINAGDSIPVSALGLLRFVPASREITESAFAFTAGSVGGGAEIACRIRLIEKKNESPTVLEGEVAVATQTGISYYGTLGASDPEGGTLYFRVTAYPKHGTLTLLDRQTGAFRYTPEDGYAGKDSFSYVVRDEYGNFSAEKEISVSVKKRASTLVYEDLTGGRYELAAIALTDAGVMLGRLSGGGLYFDAEETLSRGEFTAMAMKVAGVTPYAGVYNTCFDDNDKIPASVRPYIATAQLKGYVNGVFNGDGLYFESERAVTRAEAAVILCNVMKIAPDSAEAVFSADSGIPVWAASSVGTLCSMGVMQGAESNAALTRGEIAEILYSFLKS